MRPRRHLAGTMKLDHMNRSSKSLYLDECITHLKDEQF
ncbi:hypothetical protein ISE2_2886 [plant metagenome]|uniref:Uncharacterized protein n=1 Tax=plant metagenome TaxID=1297885 RepID=A0A484VDD4_9ZZZZ